MTAPDPRLEEIEGRANNPFAADNTLAQADEDRDYLLAELRKAQDKLARVEGLADAFVKRGEHLIEYAKTAPEDVAESLTESGGDFLHKGRLIRAAVADATGGGE